MAVWQCDFQILPESVFNRRQSGIPHQLSAKQFNRIDLSVCEWLPDNHADQISELLPEIASWSPNLRWWGSEIGDRIDLFYDNGRVVHFKIRIDVRRINIVLLRDFLGFYVIGGALFVQPTQVRYFDRRAQQFSIILAPRLR